MILRDITRFVKNFAIYRGKQQIPRLFAVNAKFRDIAHATHRDKYLPLMPKYKNCKNWQCSKCKEINRRLNINKCMNCGDSKKNGISLDKLPGDWLCSYCKINNFAKNVKCFKCSKPKMLVVINGINNKKWGIKCATIVLDGEYNIFDIMEWLRCKVACYTFTC